MEKYILQINELTLHLSVTNELIAADKWHKYRRWPTFGVCVCVP